ncbi:unnamed protein product [Pleuronectes platessa]|uniref:Uncharacterized protein n=1 Tax=Pleuronectes platessa TaxID=8262 RepID=A0A9N7VF41_PLEPL|nr:unnamed protein product [Pleuronectes platessa]
MTMETEASHMLEAALEQMDDIIAGSKAAAVDFSHNMYDLGSPMSAGPLQVVQLAEDLKLALELQPSQEERESVRAQIHTETAQALIHWLQSGAASYGNRTLVVAADAARACSVTGTEGRRTNQQREGLDSFHELVPGGHCYNSSVINFLR